MADCRFCNEWLTVKSNKIPLFGNDDFFALKLELDFCLADDSADTGSEGPEIVAHISSAETGVDISEISLKVNYCPMCGRKLI